MSKCDSNATCVVVIGYLAAYKAIDYTRQSYGTYNVIATYNKTIKVRHFNYRFGTKPYL